MYIRSCLQSINNDKKKLGLNWIGNYRRKKPSSSQPKNKKLYTKDLSGYNLFCRDQLKNKGSLKDITQKWSTLAEEQKRQYAEETAALKVQHTSDDMSPDMRCLKLKKHLKQMKIEVASLEKLGVETGVMMYDHQKPFLEVLQVSSKGASSFFDILDNFALHFKGKSSSTSAAKEPVDSMVKKVQELFNRKYSKNTLSYSSNNFSVPGLMQDTTDVCNICHCLFSDEKKNAKKKWREWRRCNTCEQWSHLACGFKKNLCRHCQTPRS
uniref:Zgc:113176 n=1 Tax=Xiphophorus maculatus TaxID=8083 RepID=A0A3B5PVA1_XIPMA